MMNRKLHSKRGVKSWIFRMTAFPREIVASDKWTGQCLQGLYFLLDLFLKGSLKEQTE